jgi:hypothetical protein
MNAKLSFRYPDIPDSFCLSPITDISIRKRPGDNDILAVSKHFIELRSNKVIFYGC